LLNCHQDGRATVLDGSITTSPVYPGLVNAAAVSRCREGADSLKILISAIACDPSRGSESGNGWNWAYGVAQEHDVWLLTSSVGKTAIQEFVNVNPAPRLTVVYVELPRVPPFFRQFRDVVQNIGWQRRIVAVAADLDAQIDFDVVHHVTWASLHVGSQLWRLEKPFVFGPVGGGQVVARGFGRYLRGGWWTEKLRSIVVRHLTPIFLSAKSTVSGASLVLFTNFETRDWITRLGAQRAEFMPDVGISSGLLVNVADRPSRVDPNCLRILWVGRLLPRKGILLALEALARISSEVQFECTIVGEGKQGKYLQRWINDLGLQNRVRWIGSLPWRKVLELYLSHDVFLFTSLRDTSGAQLIEAMSRAQPIVTLDHQGAAAIVPPSAGMKISVTTPRETAEAIARALQQLARDPPRLVLMGAAGVDFARKHTWDEKVRCALELYSSLIARPASQT
jgi:glycosyltransferase involved in cell wall biosynthesis